MATKAAAKKAAAKKAAEHVQAVVEKMPKYDTRSVQKWFLENVQTREVATRLNKLSLDGFTIFSVHASSHIGGSYEVLYFCTVAVLYVDGQPRV